MVATGDARITITPHAFDEHGYKGYATMRYGRTATFLRVDGSTIQAREFYIKPTDQLVEGFVTDDGRVIYCQDEHTKLFWFKDTQEQIQLADDESTTH